jgi:hypothetical protein
MEGLDFPSVEREFQAVAHFYAYCDESGKDHSHDMVVFNALVSGFNKWEDFSRRWMELLRQYRIDAFHAKEAFRYSQPYGIMKPGSEEERARDILPFVRAIVEGIELGVIGAIDVRAYKLPTLHKIRLNISDDPHYFAFFVVLSKILRFHRVPKDSSLGLVSDDDEAKAMAVYKFLLRMKKANQEVKKRVPTICFMDDEQSPQLQAVDLFTYLCRLRGEQQFLGKKNPYVSLSDAFDPPAVTNRETMDIEGGLYGEPQLRDYLQTQIEKDAHEQ